MESPNAGQSTLGIGSLMLLVVGGIVLYMLYRFLYGTQDVSTVVLVKDESNSAPKAKDLPEIPQPQEGGEYTFTTWVYINSFKVPMNQRKHIFELQGPNFSTLLVGLGAHKNSLIVRTHTRDPLETSPNVGGSSQSSQGTAGPNAADAMRGDGTLTTKNVDDMFAAPVTNDSILDTPPVCDLPEIDLQRWVMVTVVLNGRTVDVYLDGKLTRSCVTKSYYKVDSAGPTKPVILDRGGFDGFISGMAVSNYALNPAEIYRLYSAGPKAQQDAYSWLLSLITGSTASTSSGSTTGSTTRVTT